MLFNNRFMQKENGSNTDPFPTPLVNFSRMIPVNTLNLI